MKIALHDYAGHPFQIQLSRSLAARGHDVLHLYCSSNPTSPKGLVSRADCDPKSFDIRPIGLPREVRKSDLISRWQLERLYGSRLVEEVSAFNPDVVVSANSPLDAQSLLLSWSHRADRRFVFWLQDLIGLATHRILSKRLSLAGELVGRHYQQKEFSLLKRSDFVVGITDDFRDILNKKGVNLKRYVTIQNWAPLNEVEQRSRSNAWSRKHGLDNKFVFLYSGTLGFKHNPNLILELARRFVSRPDVRIVVNSQGEAADWLRNEATRLAVSNLIVNPFQPFDVMSDVLGSADVLICILESDSGIYSVPSKVLTYHCAGRPMLLAVPANNLAARIVSTEQTGFIVPPDEVDAFCKKADELMLRPDLCRSMAQNARRYADQTFDISAITDEFETVFSRLETKNRRN